MLGKLSPSLDSCPLDNIWPHFPLSSHQCWNSSGFLPSPISLPYSLCSFFSEYLLNLEEDGSLILFFFFFFKELVIFIYFYFWLRWVFISVRGLSVVATSGGHSSSRCAGLSLSQPLLLRSTGSRRAGSVIVAHGPSCSAACGIFPNQGLNPYPLHWQADSQPLRHQGSPGSLILKALTGSMFTSWALHKSKRFGESVDSANIYKIIPRWRWNQLIQ